MVEKSNRDGFKSNIGTILALAGSAVGLGNIWRFPYIVGENGGAAFIFVYLLIVLLICIPAFMSEFSIGRSTQKNIFGAFKLLSPKTQWYQVGIIGIIACFVIASFYSVISGWTLAFLAKSVLNDFSGMDSTAVSSMFTDFVNNPIEPALWTIGFIILSLIILISGVGNGIERYSKILMPILLIIMVILVVNSMFLDNVKDGIMFMFYPDFSKINASVILNALGQAFFSMSLGMGTIITYGSYARKKDNILKISLVVAATDIFVAILAGLIIFPAVFSFNIPAESGSNLAFITFPTIFQQMSGGYFFAIIFFLLLLVAAITSIISIIEVVVAYVSEELKIKRWIAVSLVSTVIAITSTLSAYSLADGSILKIGQMTLFGFFDKISASYLLPIGGLLVSIYVGWFWDKKANRDELSSSGLYKIKYYSFYRMVTRYFVPTVILLVFLSEVGIFKLFFD